MDPPGLLSLLACVKRVLIVVYLLGSARCSETDCACTEIPPWNQTQLTAPGCFKINSSFRYKCRDGYVRKAGTSNLIKCVQHKKWSTPSLQCIINPLDPPQTTTGKTSTTFPTSTTTTLSLDIFSSVSSETEMTSTLLPPLHTSEAPLETTLPQNSSTSSSSQSSTMTGADMTTYHTPSPSPTTSSAPATSLRIHSTSTVSSPTTTHRSRRLDRTLPSSRSSLNSTSSTMQGTDAVAIKVIAPVAVGIIVLALIGAVWFLYRRKSKYRLQQNHRERTMLEEETVPMQQKDGMT